MLCAASTCVVLLALVTFPFQVQTFGQQPKLPPATDIDPQLTKQLRQLEMQLNQAAVRRDMTVLERLVGPGYALRVGDAPEQSFPRAGWMESLRSQSYKVESVDERYFAARKLGDNLAVMSLLLTQKATSDGRDRSGDFYLVDIWKKSGDQWQMIARYSTPTGEHRPPPLQ